MKNIIIIMMALAALALAACGMNEQSPDSATSGTVVSTSMGTPVGIKECLSCHSDYYNPSSLMNVVGDSPGSSGWLNSGHGNFNNGFPYYGYDSHDGYVFETSPQGCPKCHDQLGDGLVISSLNSDIGVDIGVANRPVIGCESCHGSGEGHFGTGEMEYSKPDASRCGQCHTTLSEGHIEHHPIAQETYENFAASKHGNSINSHNYTSATEINARCSKCHTDEGARIFRDVDGGHDELVTLFSTTPPLEAAETRDMQCSTCHDPHMPSNYLETDILDGVGNIAESGQYRTCENCHQIEDSYHGEDSGHSWAGGYPFPVGFGNFDGGGIIYDTHVDNATTPWIEGYVLDTTDDNTCGDCHDVHSGSLEINNQWAKSAHGGHILERKEAGFAIVNMGGLGTTESYENAMTIINGSILNSIYGISNTDGDVREEDGPAWVHYRFKDMTGGRDGTGRQACQQCHTSTGFKNKMANAVSYDPANNNFAATGEQREMLYCWACHKTIADDLRDGWGIVNTVDYYGDDATIDTRMMAANTVLGDTGSNVCVVCHSGRGTGFEIAAMPAADFTNTSFKNSHYLAAGGTLFRTAGYEYASAGTYDDYAGLGFMHSRLGTSGAEDSSAGDNGPCVACHMRSEESHTFEPVLINGSGIYDVPAFENTCSTCHTDKAGLVTLMNTQKAGFEAALVELETELSNNGINFYPSYPYFYATPFDPIYEEEDDYIYNSTSSDQIICDNNQSVKNWLSGGTNTYTRVQDDPGPPITYECQFDAANLITGTPGTGSDNMGAAFIYNLLHHEPGAYAHNSLYTRRLIFDALQWLKDGNFDGTITTPFINSTAQTYLGVTRP
jgi:hypothetical protein